ncbi:MAG TPA: hypothetical protein VMZ50_06660 [Phycisphaerae bacterium]|nr:hypothetical protein [Phycisphaerae bacterium]
MADNHTGNPSRGQQMREIAEKKSNESTQSYIGLGKVLAEIAREGHYREVTDRRGQPFTSFEQYAEEVLGMRGRKVRYLMTIYERLVEGAGADEEMLERIGWTAASQIARLSQEALSSRAKIERWIAKAEALGHRDLEVEVNAELNRSAAARGQASTLRVEALHRETFHLFKGQYDVVERALALARRLTGSDKKGVLLERMAQDFLDGHAGEGAEKSGSK